MYDAIIQKSSKNSDDSLLNDFINFLKHERELKKQLDDNANVNNFTIKERVLSELFTILK